MGKLLERLFGKKKQPAPTPPPAPKPQPVSAPARPTWSTPLAPWKSDMVLRSVGKGEAAVYPGYSCATVRVEWASRETDGNGEPLLVRVPRPETRQMPREDFTAAGRHYSALRELAASWHNEGPLSWSRDIYDRRVLYDAEPFPCFDSSDYLYEDRYYRWFFLWEDGKLTRVQYTDRMDTVTVTEDVLDIEQKWWPLIGQLECFQ